jgi:hypothetical protein
MLEFLEALKDFVRPELLVLAPVIYFVGLGLKKWQRFKDNDIPALLGLISALLAAMWVVPTNGYWHVAAGAFGSLYGDYTGCVVRGDERVCKPALEAGEKRIMSIERPRLSFWIDGVVLLLYITFSCACAFLGRVLPQ